jgi:hypothetical protein
MVPTTSMNEFGLHAMKLPPWLVIAMLTSSALSVLAAAGWWWVTWPERTAREFVSLLGNGDMEQAKAMISPRYAATFQTSESAREVVQSDLQGMYVKAGERTWLDVLSGRGSFVAVKGDVAYPAEIRVRRGTILSHDEHDE